MNKKAVSWLYQQLPELTAKGILSAEAAERIKSHYGPIQNTSSSKSFLLVFGILGVIFVGLGIILILAHNWDELTKLTRLLISISLIILAQFISGFALYFRRESVVWRESSAVFHMLAIGAAIALVGQTYHLTEDTDAFLLTWMLLSLPMVYLLKANILAGLYLVGITFWASNGYYHFDKMLSWALLAAVFPYYRIKFSEAIYSNAALILSWIFNICFYVFFAVTFGTYIDKLGPLIFALLTALNYNIGILLSPNIREHSLSPFKVTGLTGTSGLIFLMTSNNFWNNLTLESAVLKYDIPILFAIGILTIWTFLLTLKKPDGNNVPFALAPILIGIAYLLHFYDATGISATLLMNAYMLYLSIIVISIGFRKHSIGVANIGMLMIALLIVTRFLDMNFSFVIRGIAFVILGVAFLTANLLMVRRNANEAGDTNEK
ncbi:DUF2157 domain-containing protein [Dendrosporobacter sp. 1207_IL3150]|uniref:DUF2157 domain-containing protein n=1 Tax=Dendrosporobacter sp. 1207_IL3150 TaxID=3084054 RepID=UPI002FD8E5F4